MLHDGPSFIHVRPAGDPDCCTDLTRNADETADPTALGPETLDSQRRWRQGLMEYGTLEAD